MVLLNACIFWVLQRQGLGLLGCRIFRNRWVLDWTTELNRSREKQITGTANHRDSISQGQHITVFPVSYFIMAGELVWRLNTWLWDLGYWKQNSLKVLITRPHRFRFIKFKGSYSWRNVVQDRTPHNFCLLVSPSRQDFVWKYYKTEPQDNSVPPHPAK